MSYVSPFQVKTSDLKIITCTCFYSSWKEIKDTKDESWKFDEIEKGRKCLRKFYFHKKTIVHCCYSCFEKLIIMNPFVVKEDSNAGLCIVRKFLNAINSCEEICNACIIFFVTEFENEFNYV